jgi:hypothetical protein
MKMDPEISSCADGKHTTITDFVQMHFCERHPMILRQFLPECPEDLITLLG